MPTETRPAWFQAPPSNYIIAATHAALHIFHFNMQSYAKWMLDTTHPCTTPCSSQAMVLPMSCRAYKLIKQRFVSGLHSEHTQWRLLTKDGLTLKIA